MVDLYLFDRQLRQLVMEALESIEVALRVNVSHTLVSLIPLPTKNLSCCASSSAKSRLTLVTAS